MKKDYKKKIYFIINGDGDILVKGTINKLKKVLWSWLRRGNIDDYYLTTPLQYKKEFIEEDSIND